MSTKRPLEYWQQRNELKTCKADGCTKPRYRVGGYCQKHANYHRLYGHYGHQKIQRWNYKDELADCRDIIDKNLAKDHPGILYAIRWLDLVLSGAVIIDEAHPTTDDHLCRLHQAGITGYDVLLESAALYRLYERGHPKRIHSHRHLIYMVGHRTCLLKPTPKHKGITGRTNRVIGTAINKRLGALLLSISHALDAREDAKQRERAVLYEPLSIA